MYSKQTQLINQLSLTYTGHCRYKTNIKQFMICTTPQKSEFTHEIYEPSFCIVLQGAKEIEFGKQRFYFDSSRFLLALSYVPVYARFIDITPEKPYFALTLKFTLEQVYEVLKELNFKLDVNTKTQDGLYLGDINEHILQSMSKLVELTTKSQKEADFLSPMIIKEILFYLLNDEGSGAILREFVAKGTTTNSVALAIERVKNSFSEPINIANLSRELKVSEATLYNGFKKVLGFSPIQFQKMLRLEEARRLLQSRELKVNEVAFRVGYESPSQFSREYSRMYGVAPSSCRV